MNVFFQRKSARPVFLLYMLLLAIALTLCACRDASTPDDPTQAPDKEDTTVNQSVAFPIAPTDTGYTYTVIRNEDSSEAERQALISVRDALQTAYGSAPKPETNYSTENLSEEEINARPELLIGKTGRPESEAVYAALGENDYTVRTVGNKLVVLGKTDTLTTFAVKAFQSMLKEAPSTVSADYDLTKSYIPGNFSGFFDYEGMGFTKLSDVRFETRDGENGAEITYITSDGYHYTYGYYSNNPWATPDVLIAARSASDDAVQFGNAELVALDLYEEEAWLLPITANSYYNYVVDSELIYYQPTDSELRCYNMLTGTEHTVAKIPKINFPHITANGSHINVERHVNGLDTGTVIDVKTGEYYDVFAVRFDNPFPVANHHMICPTDPTMMFFAHEGTTTEIPDRLWIAKLGEEPYNIAYQKTNSLGKPIDCFGHEFWAPDGEGLYFVKYSLSPSSPKGVCYVSLDDIENPQVLYSKYAYWHTSCSPDERYITADTQDGGWSGVCLIDTETDEETLLYKALTYRWTHPGHPHPCFNLDSTALAFNDHNLSNGRVSIGLYRIP